MYRAINIVRRVANSQQVRLVVTSFSRVKLQKPDISQKFLRSVRTYDIWHGTNSRNWNNGIKLNNALEIRNFHTSPSRKALPPVLLLLIKPISKVTAILFGRTVKRWWRALPPEKREAILTRIQKNKTKIYVLSTLIPAGFLLYYVTHLEVDPLTGRKKFIMFNHEQVLDVARVELDMQIALHENNFLPPSHPSFKKVANVCNRLLKSNNDLPQIQERKWLVTVVDEPKILNAFVLPTGHIFIFTGIINLCSNDDQLCAIISHEISHVLLNHSAEMMSNLGFLEMVLMIPIGLIWAILPDAAAILTSWLWDHLTQLTFHLPFSRSLESEADMIGLLLTAKACYDVRESTVLWAKMGMNEDDSSVEILSTHPSSEKRQQTLDSLMAGAIKLREENHCPRLPAVDPRIFIPDRQQPRIYPGITGA